MPETLKENVSVDAGAVIGFGGTNARMAYSHDGDISGFVSAETPVKPAEFFGWMARNVLEAAESGRTWMVAGFPGPVTPDGTKVGPMANVDGLKTRQHNLFQELSAADPAVGRALEKDFTLLAVNDGELAAHAAANRFGNDDADSFNRIAALIVGTGVGAGVVDRDTSYGNVVRANRSNPFEIGHIQLSGNPLDTFENRISGPALERRYGYTPKELSSLHPAWDEVGEGIAQMTSTLGVMSGVQLVVPCGGVGANASGKYVNALAGHLDNLQEFGNGVQSEFMPHIEYIDSSEADEFEMYGGESVMRDFLTREQ